MAQILRKQELWQCGAVSSSAWLGLLSGEKVFELRKIWEVWLREKMWKLREKRLRTIISLNLRKVAWKKSGERCDFWKRWNPKQRSWWRTWRCPNMAENRWKTVDFRSWIFRKMFIVSKKCIADLTTKDQRPLGVKRKVGRKWRKTENHGRESLRAVRWIAWLGWVKCWEKCRKTRRWTEWWLKNLWCDFGRKCEVMHWKRCSLANRCTKKRELLKTWRCNKQVKRRKEPANRFGASVRSSS